MSLISHLNYRLKFKGLLTLLKESSSLAGRSSPSDWKYKVTKENPKRLAGICEFICTRNLSTGDTVLRVMEFAHMFASQSVRIYLYYFTDLTNTQMLKPYKSVPPPQHDAMEGVSQRNIRV